MKRLIVILMLLFITSGCNETNTTTSTSIECTEYEEDSGVIFVSSKQNFHIRKDKEIKAKLEVIIKSKKYNITKINNIYSPAGYILASEVYYTFKK